MDDNNEKKPETLGEHIREFSKRKREEQEIQSKPFRDAILRNQKQRAEEKAAQAAAEKIKLEAEAFAAEKLSVDGLIETLRRHGYKIEKQK